MSEEPGLLFTEVKGFSMRPFLWGGEKLVVKKIDIAELKAGDLLVYRSNDMRICHRFLCKGIKDGRPVFWTRGDSIPYGREEVFFEQILGKVVGILKGKKMIDLTAWRWRFINHTALFLAPITGRVIVWASFVKKKLFG